MNAIHLTILALTALALLRNGLAFRWGMHLINAVHKFNVAKIDAEKYSSILKYDDVQLLSLFDLRVWTRKGFMQRYAPPALKEAAK